MSKFFNDHPYLRIYLIVTVYAAFLFGFGKLTRGLEWYLDKSNMWIAIAASIVGLALSVALIYYRYHPENKADKI